MKLYNTMSRRKEVFSTPDRKVRMYVCGMTPYAPSHVGHAMMSVVFDVVRRYLEFQGFEVKHVQNFTDVDDKMIAAASDTGITVRELAESNIRRYLDETDALNVLRAHEYPRATQHMPEMLRMIEALVDSEFAYVQSGDVYFRVKSDDDYGKLSRRFQEDLMAGARLEINETKEYAMDFALWKSQKSGEPAWDSPWGPGRPGWHIECSAMSAAHLGKTLDIHGGGQDLIFPHHENELAQSESYTDGVQLARFWLHNGMLRVDDNKMGKSLGNTISVEEALDAFSPDGLRLFFLSSHYRSPLTFSEQAVEAQERAAWTSAQRPGRGGRSARRAAPGPAALQGPVRRGYGRRPEHAQGPGGAVRRRARHQPGPRRRPGREGGPGGSQRVERRARPDSTGTHTGRLGRHRPLRAAPGGHPPGAAKRAQVRPGGRHQGQAGRPGHSRGGHCPGQRMAPHTQVTHARGPFSR